MASSPARVKLQFWRLVNMTMADRQKIVVVLGPTASGKSTLAFELARRLRGEILCVDSMTVYRGMDIGTAKPSGRDRAEIPHQLVDVVDPDQQYAVARFVQEADQVIADTRARQTPLIATGGTPLYYKALFEGLFEGPQADAPLRDRLREQSNEQLHARLGEVDPAAAERIHVNDSRRVIRALEVFELTGQSITSLQQEWSSGKLRHEAVFVGLNWDKEIINRRINARVKAMMDAGWLEEVRGLLGRYGALSQTAAEATGYAELMTHLQGRMTMEDAVEQTKIATRQLARRQMKWFRRFANVLWLEGQLPMEALLEKVMQRRLE